MPITSEQQQAMARARARQLQASQEHAPRKGYGQQERQIQRENSEGYNLPELQMAPEFNKLSMKSFGANLGVMMSGDEEGGKIAAKQLGGELRKDAFGSFILDLPSGSYVINKPGFSPQDVVGAAGIMGAFSPAGRAKTLMQGLGAGMATQTAIEGGQAAMGGDVDVEQIAMAGAIQPAAMIAGRALPTAMRGTKAQALPEDMAALQQAEKAQIPVMTSDIVAPEGIASKLAQQAGEKIPIVGTGGIRAAQQRAREAAGSRYVEGFEPATAREIFESLSRKSGQVKRGAGNRLDRIIGEMDTAGVVPIRRTTRSINSAVAELTKPGVIKDQVTADKLTVIKEALEEAPQSFSMLRENRTAIRETLNSIDPVLRSQLPSKTKKIVEGIYKKITEDLDEFVNVNSFEKFRKYKEADRIYAGEAEKLTKSKLKNILDKGNVTPEQVESMLYSIKPSEMKLLYQNLDTKGRVAARSALIQRAVEKSKSEVNFNPTRFTTELKKLQKNTNTFFKGREKEELEGLKNALDLTKRAQESGVRTPTGQEAIPILQFGGIAHAPMKTLQVLIGAGGLSRVYESKPVMNLLVRLKGTKEASRREQNIMEKLDRLLVPIAEAVGAEQEDLRKAFNTKSQSR